MIDSPGNEKTGRSPKNFQATTVGDQLKQKYGDRSKVFAVSNKDRSAILLGGQRGDAAYWDENGKYVTSRHYRAELPAWVAAFNAEKRAEAAFGKTWERLLPAEVYERVQGPDDAPGEKVGDGFTRVFPKKVDGGKSAISPAFLCRSSWHSTQRSPMLRNRHFSCCRWQAKQGVARCAPSRGNLVLACCSKLKVLSANPSTVWQAAQSGVGTATNWPS